MSPKEELQIAKVELDIVEKHLIPGIRVEMLNLSKLPKEAFGHITVFGTGRNIEDNINFKNSFFIPDSYNIIKRNKDEKG